MNAGHGLARMTTLTPLLADAPTIVEALRLVVADFHDRPTAEVVGKGGKRYAFFPTAVTDNIPPLSPALSDAICLLAGLHIERHREATLGVGEEDRGAMVIADILRQYRLPRTLARWTPSGGPGEIVVALSNEYIQEGTTSVYLNGVRPGDRILLVDDLISTGGTLLALIQAARRAGAEILEVFTIGEKTENGGRRFIEDATGIQVKTLIGSDLAAHPDGIRSRVTHVNLGRRLPPETFAAVAAAFPAGFCRPGSGAPA